MKTVASGICHPGQIVEDGMGNLLVTSNFGPDRCSKNTVSKIDKAGNVEIWTTLEAPAVEATTVAGEYFYFAAGNQIGRVHLATKEQTQFFTLPSNGEINALAVADADHLAVGSNRGALALLSISRKHLEVLFGAQQLRTCSMRRAAGSTVAAGIDTKIRQSLAGICPGSSILDISTHQCSGGSQQVAFAQSFPDGRAIVAIKRPCLEGL
jgi:hypothetical protein